MLPDITDLTHGRITVRLIADALELQKHTRQPSHLVAVPGTDHVIVIGTAADIAKLLPVAAPTVQAPVQTAAEVRAAALEEAAELLDKLNDSAGDQAAYEGREMLDWEEERMHTLLHASKAIRALAGQQVAQGEKGGES